MVKIISPKSWVHLIMIKSLRSQGDRDLKVVTFRKIEMHTKLKCKMIKFQWCLDQLLIESILIIKVCCRHPSLVGIWCTIISHSHQDRSRVSRILERVAFKSQRWALKDKEVNYQSLIHLNWNSCNKYYRMDRNSNSSQDSISSFKSLKLRVIRETLLKDLTAIQGINLAHHMGAVETDWASVSQLLD